MHHKSILAILISGALLVGCGSSDDDSSTEITQPDSGTPTTPVSEYNHQVTGLAVYQGALSGATVCADLNQNLVCDSDEPFTITDVDGNYQIDWKSEVETPDYYLVANWEAQTPSSNTPAEKLQLSTKRSATLPATDLISNTTINQITALAEHNGALNRLTTINLNRHQDFINSNKSASETTVLLAELNTLLSKIYKRDIDTLYQVSAANSLDNDFLITDALYRYLEQVLAGQIPALLALENVLGLSISDLKILLDDSEMTIEDFIASDPLAARIIISNAVIALGYTESPIDYRIMDVSDWDIVLDSLIQERGFKNTFTLSSLINISSFRLQNKFQTRQLFGSVMNDLVLGREFGINLSPGKPLFCWNTELKDWVNPDIGYIGYEATPSFITDNKYTTHYGGTTVPIIFEVQKYLQTDDEWGAVLASTPSALQLDKVSWPETVYRIRMAQTDNVICREIYYEELYNFSEFHDVAEISTQDIIDSLIDYNEDDILTYSDTEQTITITDDMGNDVVAYHWQLLTSPSDQPMIELTSLYTSENAPGVVNDDYYLLEDSIGGKIAVSIQLHKATSLDSIAMPLIITYDENTYEFTDTLYQHLTDLITPL
ncbi:hypothetical protein [Shewanella frigidimarina]|uniref:hypothetical protein n=1 Tax=Shewanella frigidimarina TaxID=56812 RepID=UPI003D7ACCC3